MKDLFDYCDFGDLKLNSRVIRTGLWESERESAGNFTPEIYTRYENIAASGVGLIITELFTFIARDAYSKYALTTNYTRFVREAKDLTEMVHIYGVPIFAQLGFVECNKRLEQNVSVNDLSVEDIRKIQTDFIIAAQKFDFAGFDGIQIAMGNSFFFSHFLNPSVNRREDKYGGNTLNRLRMILEIIKVLKQNTKLHINCRINAFDRDGLTVDEAIEIAKLLEKHGADSLQITCPHSQYVLTRDNAGEIPLVEAAERIIKEVDIPVIYGGGLNSQNKINEILNQTDIDFISMQRPFIADPSFLVEWQVSGNGESFCQTCHNCYAKKTSTCHLKPCSPEYYKKS